jgi:hypothetical protein
MSYLDVSTPPLKVYIRKEYLYDEEKHHGEFEEGVVVSAKSLPGTALLFQVLLNNGVLRDKLPISALVHKKDAPVLPLHFLQLWNCFSYSVVVQEIQFLCGMRVEVLMKNKKWVPGEYVMTFNWSAESVLGVSYSWAEEPSEHKSGHLIALENGCYTIQPNNRLKFSEPSFITKPFPEKPDYKVCTKVYNCETMGKWVTEDSDNYFYGIEEK